MRTEQAHLIEEGLQHLVAHRVPVVDEVLAEEHLRQRVALRRVALEGLDHLRVDRQPEVVLGTHAQVRATAIFSRAFWQFLSTVAWE